MSHLVERCRCGSAAVLSGRCASCGYGPGWRPVAVHRARSAQRRKVLQQQRRCAGGRHRFDEGRVQYIGGEYRRQDRCRRCGDYRYVEVDE